MVRLSDSVLPVDLGGGGRVDGSLEEQRLDSTPSITSSMAPLWDDTCHFALTGIVIK